MRKVFITFEIWIFILQKHMDSLQEDFIQPPEPCEARFITDAHTFILRLLNCWQKAPAYPHCKAWRCQNNF